MASSLRLVSKAPADVIKVEPVDNVSFSCLQCGELYTSIGETKRHVASHVFCLPVTCKICKLGFYDHSDLEQHHSLYHTDKRLRYNYAPEKQVFLTKYVDGNYAQLLLQDLPADAKQADTSKLVYRCKLCMGEFQTYSTARDHFAQSHNEFCMPYVCAVCEMRFPALPPLEQHFSNQHSGILDYRECEEQSEALAQMLHFSLVITLSMPIHVPTEHRPIDTDVMLDSSSGIQPDDCVGIYVAPEDTTCVVPKDNTRKNMVVDDPVLEMTHSIAEYGENQPKQIQCRACGITIADQKRFTRHCKKHLPREQWPYSCCGIQFAISDDVANHRYKSHRGQFRSFKVDAKLLQEFSELVQKLMETVETGNPVHAAEAPQGDTSCSSTLSDNKVLPYVEDGQCFGDDSTAADDIHEVQPQSEEVAKPMSFKCSLCKQVINSCQLSCILEHFEEHTTADNLPHKCLVCEIQFPSVAAIEAHVVQNHAMEIKSFGFFEVLKCDADKLRAFAIFACSNLTFATFDFQAIVSEVGGPFLSHFIGEHKSGVMDVIHDHFALPPGSFWYCMLCQYSCSRIKMMFRHFICHSKLDERPHTCSYCKACFTSAAAVRTHSSQRHPDSAVVFKSDRFRLEKLISLVIRNLALRHVVPAKDMRSVIGDQRGMEHILWISHFMRISHIRQLMNYATCKPFACKICGFRCELFSELVAHLGHHVSPSDYLHECEQCAAPHMFVGEPMSHTLKLHPSGSQTFSCNGEKRFNFLCLLEENTLILAPSVSGNAMENWTISYLWL